MPPAWKVRRGHLVTGSSVRLSVCLSVRNSVPLTIKVQYLKFGWWYNYQTWTVSSSKGCSHFTDITRPWGMGRGQNVGLRDFCHNWTLLPPGASVFHKHMSSLSIFSTGIFIINKMPTRFWVAKLFCFSIYESLNRCHACVLEHSIDLMLVIWTARSQKYCVVYVDF